ncbi:MAG: Uma2 family endonuclease [Defluviitaleaceae bacterium]|nr:Uma2 family endonuclease [Defluviitaleaceae bacterium]
MTMKQLETRRYTNADYDNWPENFRCELIDGVPYPTYGYDRNGEPCMMPAPVPGHQAILRELFGRFWHFLKGRRCQVFPAPTTVRIDYDENGDTVFEPDLVVICDRSKIDKKKGCLGAPDMIIEILSPSTRKKDKIFKKQKYQQHGVREYWIVDPEARLVDVYLLVEGRYTVNTYSDDDTAPVMVLPGLEINLTEVFAELDEFEDENESEE